MSDSLHNLARSRERTRMVRRADGDVPVELSDGDKAWVKEFADYLMWSLLAKLARHRDYIDDPFAVRGAVLRQMLDSYDREREAMEAQDAAAESDR